MFNDIDTPGNGQFIWILTKSAALPTHKYVQYIQYIQ